MDRVLLRHQLLLMANCVAVEFSGAAIGEKLNFQLPFCVVFEGFCGKVLYLHNV